MKLDRTTDMASSKDEAIPCTFEDCKQTFTTEKAMKKHKAADPEHEYCIRCDQDFLSDDHHLIHKVKSSRHIACQLCGEEFKSEGGKDAHIKQVS